MSSCRECARHLLHGCLDETYIGGKARNMHKAERERVITGTGGDDIATQEVADGPQGMRGMEKLLRRILRAPPPRKGDGAEGEKATSGGYPR